jgi:phage terminase large subunit-like protein
MIDRTPVPDGLTRVVIGVDPAGGGGDEHGIIVAGKDASGTAYVLADGTEPGTASPNTWAQAVANLYRRHEADRVVAEINFGGDMVESTLRTAAPDLPVSIVRASRGKAVRAEPVAALYETGKVKHAGTFDALESQMTTWDPQNDKGSPDRVDALVWALTDLMLTRKASLTFV